jgi:hypothetical protein
MAGEKSCFFAMNIKASPLLGESDPTGDEKFFALPRQAKCIPIVATQSISSRRLTFTWRIVADSIADVPNQDLPRIER